MTKLQNLKPTDIIFSEKTEPGVFRAKNGWYVKSIRTDSMGKVQLYNPQNEPVGEPKYSWQSIETGQDWTVYLLYYVTRYGRDMDDPTIWSPAHFPRGTIVFAEAIGDRSDGPQFFTVDRVIQNGVKSFVIEAMELQEEEGHFKGQPHSFNLHWVTGIMYRPAEQGYSESPQRTFESSSVPEYMDLYDYLRWFARNFAPEHASFYNSRLDECKALKRLKAMGLVKKNGHFYEVKTKEATKFLKKNMHWALTTVKQALKEEQEDNDRYYNSLEDSF